MVSQPWQLHCNPVFVATLIAVNKGSGFLKPTVAVILCSSRTAGSRACKLQKVRPLYSSGSVAGKFSHAQLQL